MQKFIRRKMVHYKLCVRQRLQRQTVLLSPMQIFLVIRPMKRPQKVRQSPILLLEHIRIGRQSKNLYKEIQLSTAYLEIVNTKIAVLETHDAENSKNINSLVNTVGRRAEKLSSMQARLEQREREKGRLEDSNNLSSIISLFILKITVQNTEIF